MEKEVKDYSYARTYYDKAFAYGEKYIQKNGIDSLKGIISKYLQIGEYEEEDKHFEKAEKYYRRALQLQLELEDITEGTSDKSKLGKCYYYVAWILLKKEDFEGAKSFYERGILAYLSAGKTGSVAFAYEKLARISWELGCSVDEETYYLEAVKGWEAVYKIAKTTENKRNLVRVYAKLGATFHRNGKLDSAVIYYEKEVLLLEELRQEKRLVQDMKLLDAYYLELMIIGEKQKKLKKLFQYTKARKHLANELIDLGELNKT